MMNKFNPQDWLENTISAHGNVAAALLVTETGSEPVTINHWPVDQPRDEYLLDVAQARLVGGHGAFAVDESARRIKTGTLSADGRTIGVFALRLHDVAGTVDEAANSVEPAPVRPAPVQPQKVEPAPIQPPAPDILSDILPPPLEPFMTAPLLRDAPDEGLLSLMRTALTAERFDQAASAVATELAAVFASDRVFVAIVKNRFARLEAISHGARVDRGQPVSRAVAAAMDEAIDQGVSILCPQQPEDHPRITLAHAELLRLDAGLCVLTVPMFARGRVVGALTFERSMTTRFDGPTVRRIEVAAAELAPVLQLRYDDERSPWQRQRDRLRRKMEEAGKLRRAAAGSAVFAGLAAVGLLLASSWTFEVSAPTRLEGRIERAVTAPMDGYLKGVQARAGDTVREGQLLAELNDQDLRLERQRLETEVARHEGGYAESLARQDRTQLVIASARMAEARAQLALVDQQIERTQLVAPFDGVVIKGDLSRNLGAPLKRGDLLFTLTPTREYRVILEIDERDVGAVKPGARGALTLSALPDQRFPLVVERVMPVARSESGRNIFAAEARLEDDAAGRTGHLRPGLQGVARLDAGAHSLAWLLGHRAVDWVRFKWWEWVG